MVNGMEKTFDFNRLQCTVCAKWKKVNLIATIILPFSRRWLQNIHTLWQSVCTYVCYRSLMHLMTAVLTKMGIFANLFREVFWWMRMAGESGRERNTFINTFPSITGTCFLYLSVCCGLYLHTGHCSRAVAVFAVFLFRRSVGFIFYKPIIPLNAT